MSEIDQYDHQCLGIVSCPSEYEPFPGWRREIPLYRFESESTDEGDSFAAKYGDILMGGGDGECSAVRVSIPEAFLAFTNPDWDAWQTQDELVKAYWSSTTSFIFGDGFRRLGWHPSEQPIEVWLCEHIMAFLVCEYSDAYAVFVGPSPIEQDGSICRLPTMDERQLLRSRGTE